MGRGDFNLRWWMGEGERAVGAGDGEAVAVDVGDGGRRNGIAMSGADGTGDGAANLSGDGGREGEDKNEQDAAGVAHGDRSSGPVLSRVYLPHCFDAVRAVIGQIREEIGDGGAEDRMAEAGRDLGQRGEHEAAHGEGGMGQGQPGRLHNAVVEKKEVEVQGARAVGPIAAAIAPIAALASEEEVEEGFGIKRGR